LDVSPSTGVRSQRSCVVVWFPSAVHVFVILFVFGRVPASGEEPSSWSQKLKVGPSRISWGCIGLTSRQLSAGLEGSRP